MTMVTPNRQRDDGPVVVRYDASPEGFEALRWAIDRAEALGLGLRVVHSYRVPGGPESPGSYLRRSEHARVEAHELADRVERAIAVDHPDLVVETVVAQGRPSVVLRKHSSGASALIVPNPPRHGFLSRLVRSRADRLGDHVDCPVIAVPPGARYHDLTTV